MQLDANERTPASAAPDGSAAPGPGAESPVTQRSAPEDSDREATGRVPPLPAVAQRAATLRSAVVDRLHDGAKRLRRRAARPNVDEAGAEPQGQLERAGNRLADGMESTADWLRDADPRSMRAGLEEQVRARPGRALLIALGVGYLLGRALRGRREG